MNQLPVLVQMFRLCQIVISSLFDGFFHRIKRIKLTCQNTEFKKFMKFFRHGIPYNRANIKKLSPRKELAD